MPNRSSTTNIDEYIAEFPPEVRELLERVRALVHEYAPGATETISYAIPTFDLAGRHLVHFAAFAKHLGFYPTGSGMDAFRDELGAYKTSRGTVQFPFDRPLPEELVRRMVEFRVARIEGGGR